IGLVLLMPVILLVSIRSGLPLMRVGIPALAGLSVMHGLVPPQPAPLIVGADLGVPLALGVLIAIPTVIIAGPLFSKFAAKWVPVEAPTTFVTERETALVGGRRGTTDGRGTPGTGGTGGIEDVSGARRPSFGVTLATVLLPVVLMMGKALVD